LGPEKEEIGDTNLFVLRASGEGHRWFYHPSIVDGKKKMSEKVVAERRWRLGVFCNGGVRLEAQEQISNGTEKYFGA